MYFLALPVTRNGTKYITVQLDILFLKVNLLYFLDHGGSI